MRKYKKIGGVCCTLILFFSWSGSVGAASTAVTKITGTITSGALSLSVPQNLAFTAKLNGKPQSLDLDTLKTTITDERGIENGWRLTVKSSNFDAYKQNYQLRINKKQINQESIVVYENATQTLETKLQLPTTVEVSADAKKGSFDSNLEWNLQPNIKNTITE